MMIKMLKPARTSPRNQRDPKLTGNVFFFNRFDQYPGQQAESQKNSDAINNQAAV